MSGWYRMHRGWMSHDIFEGEPFSRRTAWVWLIENAAWEAHSRWFKGRKLDVGRGQIAASERDLAAAWSWDRQRVRTFLANLEETQNLTRAITQGITLLTLCNYAKYQVSEPNAKPNNPPASAGNLTQQKPTIEEDKENKEEGAGKRKRVRAKGEYAFEGEIVKINQAKLDEWRAAYHAIPDLVSELRSIDSWLANQALEIREDWFRRTPRMLNKPHQEWLAKSPRGSPTSGKVIDSGDLFLRRLARFEREQAAEKGAG